MSVVMTQLCDAAGQWTRPAPVTQQDFLRSLAARRRYWARSLLGWPHFAAARPNAGHCALTDMARHGVLAGLVTQNVDGLHERAGSVGRDESLDRAPEAAQRGAA